MSNNETKYKKYLKWFEDNVKDESNWSWMRKDRDCQNWETSDQDIEGNLTPKDPGKPIPWDMSTAIFMMSDPKKMAKALGRAIGSNKKMYDEMSQYINGDPKQGTFNKEYAKNYENLKILQAEMNKQYSVYTQFHPDHLEAIVEQHMEKHKEVTEEWRPLSWWEALWHKLTGNEVVEEQSHKTWRDK